MISGKLRQRIIVYKQELLSDGCGGFTELYALKGRCWAEVLPTVPANTEESLIDSHLKDVKFFNVKTRQNIGFVFLTTDIIIFKGDILRITGVSNIQERDYGFSIKTKAIGGDSVELQQSGIFSQDGIFIMSQNGTGIYNQLGA